MSDGGMEIGANALALQPVAEQQNETSKLRLRFRQVGSDKLSDTELLMLLLMPRYCFERAEAIAERLIAEYRTFPEVLNAPRHLLMEIKGVGPVLADTIATVRECLIRSARAEIIDRKYLDTWDKTMEYLQLSMGYLEIEQFRCLYLNTKNVLIADEVMNEGTVDHTPVYPREVVRRSLLLGAKAVILVHNHPSGDPTPSRADIQMTRQLVDIAKPLDIEIYDHFIMSRGASFSFRAMQLI
ncbi:RadC family protein [Roseibium sp.]|uniref:RadC family protein n=1 Tax=Roseibium sp. TaxID=1936156 RepID=UPI003B5263FB